VIPLLLALIACEKPAVDPGETATTGDDSSNSTPTDTDPTDPTEPTDTTEPTETEPVDEDRDSDGSPASEDCDDLDPQRYPGATELWDGIDNDCDERVDADGPITGTARLSASVVYKATPYAWAFDCPITGERAAGALQFTVACAPTDPDEQEQIDLLLGETLTITPYPGDEDVEGDEWSGWVSYTSAQGWDSEGDGRVTWTDFDSAEITLSLDSVWLNISGSGSLARE